MPSMAQHARFAVERLGICSSITTKSSLSGVANSYMDYADTGLASRLGCTDVCSQTTTIEQILPGFAFSAPCQLINPAVSTFAIITLGQ